MSKVSGWFLVHRGFIKVAKHWKFDTRLGQWLRKHSKTQFKFLISVKTFNLYHYQFYMEFNKFKPILDLPVPHKTPNNLQFPYPISSTKFPYLHIDKFILSHIQLHNLIVNLMWNHILSHSSSYFPYLSSFLSHMMLIIAKILIHEITWNEKK